MMICEGYSNYATARPQKANPGFRESWGPDSNLPNCDIFIFFFRNKFSFEKSMHLFGVVKIHFL